MRIVKDNLGEAAKAAKSNMALYHLGRTRKVHGMLSLVLAAALLLALVGGQPAASSPGGVTIPYGRSWPLSLAIDQSKGLVYFDATSGIYPPTGFSFGVINATSHLLVDAKPLDVVPGPVAFDSSMNRVFVAGSGSIEVFDAATRAFVGNISVGLPILDMTFDSAVSKNLYFTSGGSVYEISPTAGDVIANASVGKGAGGLVLDPANGNLYVADYLSDAIHVFTTSLAPVGTITTSSCCLTQLALNPGSQMLYATTGTNYVAIINAGAGTFVKTVAVAPSPQNATTELAVDGGSGRVFVSFSAGGAIAEMDPSGAVLGYLTVTSAPGGMGVDTSTGELFVTNYHQVTVFDARLGLPVADYSRAVLFLLGAGVAAAVLVLVLKSSTWRYRNRGGQGATA